ncbi:hypothetical protein P4O66_008912 [Electrophorus voltai]|uniref:OAR domain-containing protein n=1 Tax=Electrophorus voltai TaxID=2609070 RepID=A0AAD8ZC98_9TELE|nr:hypothetical protein P4O66_008912 [Electrophorus voltai]
MAAYPPTCSNTTSTQGMNMANSIANLRLKAKEYNLNQVHTPGRAVVSHLSGSWGHADLKCFQMCAGSDLLAIAPALAPRAPAPRAKGLGSLLQPSRRPLGWATHTADDIQAPHPLSTTSGAYYRGDSRRERERKSLSESAWDDGGPRGAALLERKQRNGVGARAKRKEAGDDQMKCCVLAATDLSEPALCAGGHHSSTQPLDVLSCLGRKALYGLWPNLRQENPVCERARTDRPFTESQTAYITRGLDTAEMSGFPYQGRHCAGSGELIPKNRTPMSGSSCGEVERGPRTPARSLREFEQHLHDLKKENFNLKLRIYFLEEKIQKGFEDSGNEDVHRKNIELKVEVESLKQELQQRQLLHETRSTAEGLTNQNEAHVPQRCCCEERQTEINHMQETLERKLQLLQEQEARLWRSQAEKVTALERKMTMDTADEERRTRDTQNEMLAEKERLVEELSEALRIREEEVASLIDERVSLTHTVTQLEEQLQVLNKSRQQKEQSAKVEQDALKLGGKHEQLEMQLRSSQDRTPALTSAIMLDSKTKELCRVCGRELCGNQRRWIFHPAAKLSLQVLLSHALGWELTRDGRGEFVCSKCAFMLDRMYRFDTVIARVEALSIERMHKLLMEKDRLRQCIGGLYRKNNAGGAGAAGTEASVLDVSVLSDGRYGSLLEEDLTYSVYESWAEHESHSPHRCYARSEVSWVQRSRKCRGCAALRVADSDYEAVCKVPRKVGRTMSSEPSTHHSTTVLGSVEDARSGSALQPEGPDPESPTLTEISRSVYTPQAERTSLSPATSDESLDTGVDAGPSCPVVPADLVQGEMEEGRVITQNPGVNQKPRTGDGGVLELALSLVQSLRFHPVQVPAGSRLPVPIGPVSTLAGGPVPLPQTPPTGTLCPFSTQPEDMVSVSIRQEMQLDLAEMEELWLDDYVQFRPPDLRKKLIGEQLGQCEAAAGQCVSELQKAQQEVRCLQTKNREASSKNLQQRLSEMDCELRAVREAAHRQERNIQNLNECLNTRNSEVADLQKLTEEQKELLCSLKQQNLQEQLQAIGEVPGQLQAELLELQASLFSTQLELQAAQRAQRHAQRREEDLARTNQRLLADLQGALHQQQEVEKHKQDLLAALERARSDLEQTQERWRKGVEEKERETEGKQERIRELQTSLHHKERLLQDYSELADRPGGNRDVLVHKLKQRLQERDRALERALDEKFMCVEQKEAELRKLQLRLREKERDMEKLRCVLSNNEETITSLEALLRGKALELEQVCEAWRSSQRAQRDSEDIHTHGLRERDTLISQLKTAVHTHTEEVKELKAAMLSKVPVGSAELVEVLRSQLQLKDRLFQELLANCSRNAQEHHAQVQDLLNAIRSRDQYIKDSAVRAGHVMSEQAARVQELRRQVLSAPSAPLSITEPSAETQSLQEDLRLLLAREREAQSQISTLRSTLTSTQDQLHAHASELEALTRTVSIKDEIIKDLQGQLLKPPSDPLVKRLTQDLQELRERVSRQDASCPKHEDNPDSRASLEAEQAVRPQAASGDFTSDDEEEEDDYSSEFSDSMEEENSRLTAQSLTVVQVGCPLLFQLISTPVTILEPSPFTAQDYERCGGPAAWPLSQGAAAAEDQGLAEVKLLVDQKKAVERELCELRAQLEKAGFSSFSQMRKALISLRSENEELRSSAGGREGGGGSAPGEEEEERRGGDSSVAKPQAYEGRKGGARPLLSHTTQEHTEHDSRPVPLSPIEAGLRERTVRLTSDLQQEQQERPLVSEDRVQAQAEQLGDHRDLLTEVSVQQDSKQVQVDLQDLGYETCGRSENEAERDGASSPEFDDLNLCTSLSCGDGTTQWWLSPGAPARVEGEAAFLRRLVEDLRGQLSRSQALACSLKARVDGPPASTPRKVNWGVDSLRAQDGAEEDEGWQSSDGGSSLPCRARLHGGLRQLVARVTSLEEQLQRGKNHMDEDHSTTWPGKFDTLIQAQARELSHLRQRLSEGRSLCHILTQHLGNTTKAFEELLRANDVDYYMGQGFREQLGQSSALAQRVSAKISSRDHSQLPDDKTGHELLAFRLFKVRGEWTSPGLDCPNPTPHWMRLVQDTYSSLSCVSVCRRAWIICRRASPDRSGSMATPLFNPAGLICSFPRTPSSDASHDLGDARLSVHVGSLLTGVHRRARLCHHGAYFCARHDRTRTAGTREGVVEAAGAVAPAGGRAGRAPWPHSGGPCCEREAELLRRRMEREKLSKELQQKEKVIETLRSKLEQEQSRPETPGSSHAVSEGTDQSEQMSFVSDEQGSINEELDVSSDLDAASQFSQEEATEKDTSDCHSNQSSAHSHPLMMPSLTSSHDHRSSSNCPSIHCTPHRLMEGRVPTGLSSAPFPQSRPTLSAHPASLPFDPQSQHLRPRYCGNGGFSLAEVQQELQMLQRQFGNKRHCSCVTGSSVKPLPGYPVAAGVQPTPCGFHPLSQHAFHQAPLASLSASPGSRLLENSALWDMTYGAQQMRGNVCGDVSSGSSGCPSGQHHTGAGWMETNLRDIRSLHRRLEDSIQTNDGLRRQLEARLTTTAPDGGAPTNIYIQGLDSVTQLSRDVQALKEENCALHDQLQQARRDGMKEAEQLREALQSGRGRLKQAEAEAERWAGQCRQLQEQVLEQTQVVLQLKRDRQDSQENADRLQHEVNVLQNQLSESRRLAHTLQGEGQVYQRARSSNKSVDAGAGLSLTFDLQESQSHLRMLEKQLSDRLDLNMPRPSARKQFFHDVSCSPPVRDTGLFGPNSHLPSGLDDPQSGFLEPCLGGREGEACRTGCHVMGHEDNFNTLQQAVLEAKVLIRKMETALQQGCGRSLLSSTKLLKQVLEEMGSVLGTFWGASLPSAGTTTTQHFPKDKSLKEEVVCLKRKLLEQDQVLREALDSLRSSNRTKDSMEQFIVSQPLVIFSEESVLSVSPSVPNTGCAEESSHQPRGEVPTITCTSSCGWGNVTPPPRGPKRGTSDPWPAPRSGMYRPLEVVGGSVLPGLRAAVSPLC